MHGRTAGRAWADGRFTAVLRRRWCEDAVVVLAAALAGLVPAQHARALTLVEDGTPKATILLGSEPTGSAQLAAYELQHYLKKISGATLPIVREPGPATGTMVLVGESNAARDLGYGNETFSEQEYAIKSFPNALLLMGHDGRHPQEVRYEEYRSLYEVGSKPIGTCYAVHTFLEKVLGVRWYYPNEDIGEVVPRAATVAIDAVSIRRRPDAPIRSIYPLFSNTAKLTFTDWDQPKEFQSSWVDPRLSLLYWIRNRLWGAMRYNANHSFHGYDAAFGESHPEWFSTKSYERMKQLRYQGEVQPCFTAPGFFEQVVRIARDYFDGKEPAYPDVYRATTGNFFPIVPNDNTNMCGCPGCRTQYRSDFGPAGNASHYVWGFVNRVAGEVRRTHPKAMISGLAYFNYTTPPKGMVFEHNVAVTFCKFYQKYHDRNYQERDYKRIAEYVHRNKAGFLDSALIARLMERRADCSQARLLARAVATAVGFHTGPPHPVQLPLTRKATYIATPSPPRGMVTVTLLRSMSTSTRISTLGQEKGRGVPPKPQEIE